MSEMKEYFPWSKGTWVEIKQKVRNGILPIIDLQLGGACNLGCVYCDTPRYHEKSELDLSHIKTMIDSGNIDWCFVCGLGEPTAGKNREQFKELLRYAKDHHVKVSAFSNIVSLDNDFMDFIDDGTFNILFKLDTFDPKLMKLLYGTRSSEKIRSMLNNTEMIREIASSHTGGATNIGASIVLTNKNMSEGRALVDYCIKNGIFPLLGELEKAGSCSSGLYKRLVPDNSALQLLKDYLKNEYGVLDYKVPLCPAAIGAIHVDNHNMVSVDELTGLSCFWFALEDNNTMSKIEIGDIRQMSIDEITSKIIEYRQSRRNEVVRLLDTMENPLLGGCGGTPKELLTEYKSTLEK